jgi:AraC-like DNA-binding protein
VLKYVLEHYGEAVSVEQLAKEAHLSVSQLQREFRRLFGMSPTDYLLKVRLLMSRRFLEQEHSQVGEIAHQCGFYDQSHFSRAFRKATGLRPLEYRKRFAPKV